MEKNWRTMSGWIKLNVGKLGKTQWRGRHTYVIYAKMTFPSLEPHRYDGILYFTSFSFKLLVYSFAEYGIIYVVYDEL